jgi:hypothetical protein
VPVEQEELLIADAGCALVAEVLLGFGTVRLRAFGASMWPAIRAGDVLTVSRCGVADLTAGDVILVHPASRLIAHRLVAIESQGTHLLLIVLGDAHRYPDPPISIGELLGRVVSLERRRAIRPAPCHLGLAQRAIALSAGLAIEVMRRLRVLEELTPRAGRSTTRPETIRSQRPARRG